MSALPTRLSLVLSVFVVLGLTLCILYNATTSTTLKHVQQYQRADGFTFLGSLTQNIQAAKKDRPLTDCPTRNLTYITKTPDFKHVALLSYPGSGNTWTRHLIQELTGFYTGSVYTTKLLQRNGFSGEQIAASHRSKGCLVYKSHRQSNTVKFDKAVILIRNPFNALKAFYNYRFGAKSVSHPNNFFRLADPSKFNSSGWYKYTKAECNKWQNSYASWMKTFENRFLLVRYIDLKQNLNHTLKKISKYLHVRPTEMDYYCTYVNQEGNFHRQQQYDLGTSDMFSDKQIDMINAAIRNVIKVAKSKYKLRDFLFVKK